MAPEDLTVSELKEYLRKQLPEYMIPSSFTQIDEMPLTSNGKVDKKALLKFTGTMSMGTAYVKAETTTEKSE